MPSILFIVSPSLIKLRGAIRTLEHIKDIPIYGLKKKIDMIAPIINTDCVNID